MGLGGKKEISSYESGYEAPSCGVQADIAMGFNFVSNESSLELLHVHPGDLPAFS